MAVASWDVGCATAKMIALTVPMKIQKCAVSNNIPYWLWIFNVFEQRHICMLSRHISVHSMHLFGYCATKAYIHLSIQPHFLFIFVHWRSGIICPSLALPFRFMPCCRAALFPLRKMQYWNPCNIPFGSMCSMPYFSTQKNRGEKLF